MDETILAEAMEELVTMVQYSMQLELGPNIGALFRRDLPSVNELINKTV